MIETKEKRNIKDLICKLNGKQIIFDSDLAILYNMEPKRINEAVKRNIEKFPNSYYFKVSESKYCALKSHSATSKGGSRKGHGAFTKDGILVLSNILKTDNCFEITNDIIDAFNSNEIIVENSLNPYKIKDYIYEIDGVQVMTDYDLAKFYKCKNGTKNINLAVKRNIERFPDDFYFQLNEQQVKTLRFQIETLNKTKTTRVLNSKYLPYVFTEQGVAMLATILKTEIAAKVSIDIMRAFVFMKHYLNENNDINKSLIHINNKLIEYDEKFDYLFNKFDKKEFIYLPGQIFDAYTDIVSILKQASNEIIIIDPYLDINILNIIKTIDTNVILITSNKSKLTKQDISKYKEQYDNFKNIYYDNTFHDRYFILDKKDIYHSGTSVNHAGNKLFNITKLQDIDIKNVLIDKINKII